MISINVLQINEFATKIDVNVSTAVGSNITQVLLWDSTTFKNYSKAIDLSSLLEGTTETENFAIDASLIGVKKFSGLYFIEFTSNEVIVPDDCVNNINTGLGIVANLIPYHECILDKVMSIEIKGCKQIELGGSECSECSEQLLFINTLLQSVYSSIKFGFYEEAIKILNNLNELCEICNTCPDYGNTLLINGLGFGVQNNSIIQVK